MLNIAQSGLTQGSDPISIILNLMFFLLIFVSMFYGQKLQGWKASKEIQTGLDKLKKWNDECKEILMSNFKEFADKKKTQKDLTLQLEDFITFVTIPPVSLDPYGIIPKFDHVVDVRDFRFKEEIKLLAPHADDVQRFNLENLMEVTMQIDFIYRLIRHYLILGKKSKSMILLLQISMQLGLIINMAKAYYHAAKAFAEGSPIGDGLGPLVVASFIRDVAEGDIKAHEITRETIVQELEFEERTIFIVRAKGPGGSVGKPGKAIKEIIDKNGEEISRIIMIDAGLKLTGDKTGSMAIGVGAAIGGIGIEKHFIEESSTGKSIPIDALICKQSLEDAITTMKRPITQSVPKFVDKIKMSIRKRTEKGAKIIIAGIGNTIGIGV
ncbi:MAG: DUF1512 family protein [Promethearchaeota archaeon]|jgi:hypothetical protein